MHQRDLPSFSSFWRANAGFAKVHRFFEISTSSASPSSRHSSLHYLWDKPMSTGIRVVHTFLHPYSSVLPGILEKGDRMGIGTFSITHEWIFWFFLPLRKKISICTKNRWPLSNARGTLKSSTNRFRLVFLELVMDFLHRFFSFKFFIDYVQLQVKNFPTARKRRKKKKAKKLTEKLVLKRINDIFVSTFFSEWPTENWVSLKKKHLSRYAIHGRTLFSQIFNKEAFPVFLFLRPTDFEPLLAL